MKMKIESLSTGFLLKKGERKVLHQKLDLELSAGELVCILGPNGAGKSTLLKTLLGFDLPLEGKVFFNDKELRQISVREMAQIVAVVLTDKIDDIYLTAHEIISTGRYPYGGFTGKLSAEDISQIERAENQVGISHLTGNVFSKLSDGEKQKVMIARAIAQDTPFIFLDEPVAFIDAPSKIGLMQLLYRLVSDMGKGILMATHDLDSALNYSDRIWLLGKNGEWDEGKPDILQISGKINHFFDSENVSYNIENKRFNWTGE